MADRAVAVATRVEPSKIIEAIDRLPEEIRITRDIYAPGVSDAELFVFAAVAFIDPTSSAFEIRKRSLSPIPARTSTFDRAGSGS